MLRIARSPFIRCCAAVHSHLRFSGSAAVPSAVEASPVYRHDDARGIAEVPSAPSSIEPSYQRAYRVSVENLLAHAQQRSPVTLKATSPVNPDVSSAVGADASSTREMELSRVKENNIRFVNLFARFLRHQTEVERRTRFSRSSRNVSSLSPTPQQLQRLLSQICDIVEGRQVPLIVASRLLKPRWPQLLFQSPYDLHHTFVSKSILAWTAQDVKGGQLKPSDARAVLDNIAFHLRDGTPHVITLVGALATLATADLQSQTQPEALIEVLWAVQSSKAPAPDSFWHAVVRRLVELDHTSFTAEEPVSASFIANLPPQSTHTDDTDADDGAAAHNSPDSVLQTDLSSRCTAQQQHQQKRETVGHVFSGLTTRQIYRLLRVLDEHGWRRNMAALHKLADEALKNIVFEVEAADFANAFTVASASQTVQQNQQKPAPVSRIEIGRRIGRVSDLNINEFLHLLSIAGGFHISFSVSTARVAEDILVPLAPYASRAQLRQLLVFAREANFYSPRFLECVATRLMHGDGDSGANHAVDTAAPQTLPLAKSLVRTILRDPAVLADSPELTAFVEFFADLCSVNAFQLRAMELASLSDLLYGLSRRFSPTSPVGLRIRQVVDIYCLQLDRLLQLEVAPLAAPSRILEHTVVLGMRKLKPNKASAEKQINVHGDGEKNTPAAYPHVATLLETWQVVMMRKNSQMDEGLFSLGSDGASTTLNVITEEDALEDLAEGQEEEGDSEKMTHQQLTQPHTLPLVSGAAVRVYEQFIFMYERRMVLRAPVEAGDTDVFEATLRKSGLYAIFLGAYIMREAHFNVPSRDTSANEATMVQEPPSYLPQWIETATSAIVEEKISAAQHLRVSDEAGQKEVLLHLLGQWHCDADKIRMLMHVVERSALVSCRRSRSVWLLLMQLARYFGGPEEQEAIRKHLEKALH